MSFRLVGKSLRCLGVAAFLWFAMPTVSWGQTFGTPTAASNCGTCGPTCQTHHCPPAFKYCYEGAPHIHWRRGCPHPICNPCDLPHWGYYETCWSPWPFPPNWGHCLTPPPAAFVQLNPMVHPQMPMYRTPAQPGSGSFLPPSSVPNGAAPIEDLPQPRRADVPR